MDDWWKLSAQLLGVDAFLHDDRALSRGDDIRDVYRHRGALFHSQAFQDQSAALYIVGFDPLRTSKMVRLTVGS